MASHVVEWALEHNYMDSDEWAWAQPQGEDGPARGRSTTGSALGPAAAYVLIITFRTKLRAGARAS